MMGLKKLQEEVDEWAQRFKIPYWPAPNMGLRMAEEVGELAELINHYHGPKKIKPSKRQVSPDGRAEIGEELADIVFTAICVANSQGIDLDAAWKSIMDGKCYGRDKSRYELKEPGK